MLLCIAKQIYYRLADVPIHLVLFTTFVVVQFVKCQFVTTVASFNRCHMIFQQFVKNLPLKSRMEEKSQNIIQVSRIVTNSLSTLEKSIKYDCENNS